MGLVEGDCKLMPVAKDKSCVMQSFLLRGCSGQRWPNLRAGKVDKAVYSQVVQFTKCRTCCRVFGFKLTKHLSAKWCHQSTCLSFACCLWAACFFVVCLVHKPRLREQADDCKHSRQWKLWVATCLCWTSCFSKVKEIEIQTEGPGEGLSEEAWNSCNDGS